MGDSRKDNHWDFAREDAEARNNKIVSQLKQRAPSPQELEQERRKRSHAETKYLSAADLKMFPTEAKYWGLKKQTMTYDSGYGHNGQPDMTTDHYWSIVIFDTVTALEDWVVDCERRQETYRVIHATPVTTEVKAVVSIVK